jgi:hypothetical protein
MEWLFGIDLECRPVNHRAMRTRRFLGALLIAVVISCFSARADEKGSAILSALNGTTISGYVDSTVAAYRLTPRQILWRSILAWIKLHGYRL